MLQFNNMPRRIAGRAPEREYGFGKNMVTNQRMMNPDGTFNVERQRVGFWDNIYFMLVTMHWWGFIGLIFLIFVALNSVFAGLYYLIGIEHLSGATPGPPLHNFMQAYFFSSQTLTTVGYGHISPDGLMASILASFESFLGLLAFALISGLLYGRFSRQRAKIVFSENMLVAPYRDIRGLMFRIGNARRSEILDAEAQIILAVNQKTEDGALERKFFPLELQISRISFFSLSWTVVHPLDERSPLSGFTAEDLLNANAEFLVMVKGMDEINHSTVNARRSYIADEVVWDARFRPIVSQNAKGQPHVMMRKIGTYEKLETAN